MLVDVAIVTALREEAECVKHASGLKWDQINDVPTSSRQYLVATAKNGTTIALCFAPKMGQIHSAALTADVLRDTRPRLIILTGIAGGIAKANERMLGDVLIPSDVVYYEHKKMEDGESQDRWEAVNLSHIRTAFADTAHSMPWEEVEDLLGPRPKVVLPARHHGKEPHAHPGVHDGPMFSGEKIIADRKILDELRKKWPLGVGIEMESAGVALTVNSQRSPCNVVVVKGISDFADIDKDDSARTYAARAAAVCIFRTIESLSATRLGTRPQLTNEDRVSAALSVIVPDLIQQGGFRYGLAQKLVESMIEETSGIVANDYTQNLSTGAQFLVRANQIFKPASEVLAVSVDSVSTFWTDEQNRTAAYKYLKAQSDDTTRLFVFTDADTAHRYGKVLDAHFRQYRNVFVTTADHYKSLLSRWAVPSQFVSPDTDFAILDYSLNGEPPANVASVLATLDDHRLFPKRLVPENDEIVGSGWDWRFRESFSEFKSIPEGEADAEKKVLRWSLGFWKHRDWPDRLQELFSARPQRVFHVVLFRGAAGGKLEQALNAAYTSLSMKRRQEWGRKYGMEIVWFGSRHDWNSIPRDGTINGELRVDAFEDLQYIIIMSFASESGLRHYYEDAEHSEIRRSLYSQFDERLDVLYQLLDKNGHEKGIPELLYECIESIAVKTIQRLDFRDHRSIGEMTEEEPYEPLADQPTDTGSDATPENGGLEVQIPSRKERKPVVEDSEA